MGTYYSAGGADSNEDHSNKGDSNGDQSNGDQSNEDHSNKGDSNEDQSNEGTKELDRGLIRGFYRKYRKFLLSVFLVFFVLVLIPFLAGGVWPPYYSVVSDSMNPTISKGDMVYIVDEDRFSSDGPYGLQTNLSYPKGDIIVYYPNGDRSNAPVIHRVMFYVEEGESWSEECDQDKFCPATNSGLITKGDNNTLFDQESGISRPVKESWIIGKSTQKIPHLGRFNILTYLK